MLERIELRAPQTVKDMSQALHMEIEGGIVSTDSKYHQNIFKSATGDACIKAFIDRIPYYDQGRWHTIPEKPAEEKALYAPFMELLKHILAYFKYNGRGRRLVDTHNVEIFHKDLQPSWVGRRRLEVQNIARLCDPG